jgi:glycosyltransferase involved in cell wall biosynthesis
MLKVLLVVSAAVPNEPAKPLGPRKDYAVLAETLGATVLDHRSVERSAATRLIARVVGVPAAQAWLAFRQRHTHDAILTDGEHIGIPLALLLKLVAARTPHVTIGHRLSTSKKRPFFRWLRAHSHIARIALHSTLQREIAIGELGISPERLALLPYQVDTEFWRPQPVVEERLICSAGLEHRDYPTLFQATEGLDVRVVVGAASYWSRQQNTAAGVALPANVKVDAFDYRALRDLYARAAIVVVPLDDVDFQAGVTTILEAMAMGKPVIVSHTQGQTDVVEDRRTITRSDPPRPRPESLLRRLAAWDGVPLEPNGFYVPPRNPAALRAAITYLLDHPAARARLGAAGRRTVERLLTVDQFAARLRALVDEACAEQPAAASADSGSLRLGARLISLRRQD